MLFEVGSVEVPEEEEGQAGDKGEEDSCHIGDFFGFGFVERAASLVLENGPCYSRSHLFMFTENMYLNKRVKYKEVLELSR